MSIGPRRSPSLGQQSSKPAGGRNFQTGDSADAAGSNTGLECLNSSLFWLKTIAIKYMYWLDLYISIEVTNFPVISETLSNMVVLRGDNEVGRPATSSTTSPFV